MVFINQSQAIGMAINGMTNDVTGASFLTFGLIALFIFVIVAIFRLPFDVGIILCMPLCLVIMAYDYAFIPVGLIVLFFGAVILARNLFTSG